jgi:hypothetical protein
MMNKDIEQEDAETPSANEPDVLGLLKKIQQHLVFLERKIDTLMGQAPQSSFKGRSSSEHRKPFGNSFHQDRGNFRRPSGGGGFHRERRPDGNRSFGDRPRGHGDRPSYPPREGGFDRPASSEGERSFQGKGRFPRHRKGPPRRSF